jgi:hypothetical protein
MKSSSWITIKTLSCPTPLLETKPHLHSDDLLHYLITSHQSLLSLFLLLYINIIYTQLLYSSQLSPNSFLYQLFYKVLLKCLFLTFIIILNRFLYLVVCFYALLFSMMVLPLNMESIVLFRVVKREKRLIE